MTQPNFANIQGAAPGSDLDNLSDEQIQQLINDAHKLKTGRQGRVAPVVQLPQKNHVDIDYLIKKYGGQ